MGIGSTGRCPVGFGGPPKPPTQLPLTMRPPNTRTPPRNLNAVYLCAVRVSAVFRGCVGPAAVDGAAGATAGSADWQSAVSRIGNPQTVHCTCAVADRQVPTRKSLGSTGRWPVGFGGPPKPSASCFRVRGPYSVWGRLERRQASELHTRRAPLGGSPFRASFWNAAAFTLLCQSAAKAAHSCACEGVHIAGCKSPSGRTFTGL